ncbi:MAG: NAD(P)-dependent oxidoreductase [Euzebya sp.]
MRILIADAFPEPHLEQLRSSGHDVVSQPSVDADTLVDAVAGAEILIVRSTRVEQAAIEAGTDLRLIIRAGAGTNTIDTTVAARHAIYVCNVPGRNAVAVAELTMGLLLALDRHIPQATADLRAGRWDKARYAQADGIMGKRMAVIGLGAIGTHVATRACAFGMTVTTLRRPGWSDQRAQQVESLGVHLVNDLTELLGSADVVTLHLPLSSETRNLVDAGFLAAMTDGAWLLNTSRGELVDEAALITALDERGMRAGLDVFCGEPSSSAGDFDHPLATHPSVVGTHHIGASTEQAQSAIADGVLQIIDAYVGGQVEAAVNLETEPLGNCALVVRHLDEVGVLSQVLGRLSADGINVEQMDNRIFAGAHAGVATLRLSRQITPDTRAALEAMPQVLSVVPTPG